MTSVILGEMFAYPLHPQSWTRPSGSLDYRVTNSYDGPDYLNGGKHRATDCGNFRTGHAVKSPAVCQATGLRHSDGALGVRFDLGSGVVVELWHLATTLPIGTTRPVAKGQSVGTTGNTGATLPGGTPMPAHTHVVGKRGGVPFDIEPHLPMPERAAKPLVLTVENDPMDFGGAELDAIDGVPAFTLDNDSHFRQEPNRSGGSYQVFPKGTSFAAAYTVDGETVAGNDQWYETRLFTAGKYRLGYIHTSVATRKAGGADCSALENKIAAARTALDGAMQAHSAEGKSMTAARTALG